jgi:ABC-2 type transport system ATP-binding protein
MRIEVSQLVKHFGDKTVLAIPHLVIKSGESFGLIGNNGAGKTTFLRLLLDLMRTTQGGVHIDGQNVAVDTHWKAKTGSYLDASFLIDFLSPEEYFYFVGSVYGLSRSTVDERLAKYMPFFNGEILGHDKLIREFSQGNKKKVGIGAAMMVEPQLLILDEPFAMLDPTTQIRLKQLLLDLNAEHQTTLLISSHDLSHVTEVCERIVLLNGGRVAQDIQTSEATLQELEHYFASGQAEVGN